MPAKWGCRPILGNHRVPDAIGRDVREACDPLAQRQQELRDRGRLAQQVAGEVIAPAETYDAPARVPFLVLRLVKWQFTNQRKQLCLFWLAQEIGRVAKPRNRGSRACEKFSLRHAQIMHRPARPRPREFFIQCRDWRTAVWRTQASTLCRLIDLRHPATDTSELACKKALAVQPKHAVAGRFIHRALAGKLQPRNRIDLNRHLPQRFAVVRKIQPLQRRACARMPLSHISLPMLRAAAAISRGGPPAGQHRHDSRRARLIG